MGARRWIARIMLSAACVFVTGTKSFVVVRFFARCSGGCFYPGTLLYLTTWFPSHRKAAIVALFIRRLLWLEYSGIHSQDGSSSISAFGRGLPAVLGGTAVLLFLNDTVRSATWLNDETKLLLAQDLEADDAQGAKNEPHSLAAVLRDGCTWMLTGICFTPVMGQYGLTF